MGCKNILKLILIMITTFTLSCKQEVTKDVAADFYSSDFFKEVQLTPVFEDSKTFVDMRPKISKKKILEYYKAQKDNPDFNLQKFIYNYFDTSRSIKADFITDSTKTMYEHISSMWPVLTRNADKYHPYSSRIALPRPYIVPGGRFREIYYWDSYFTMLGLMEDHKDKMALNMVDNFSYLIDSLGFVPNGNRNYYLSRSQPPFYTLMVTELAKTNPNVLLEYLPYIQQEYDYWMKGADSLTASYVPINSVMQTNNGVFLNRYWDYKNTPREESYREDVELAASLSSQEEKMNLYRDLRAAACSGWDFSSRWYAEPNNFKSTQTTQIAPVDLNCLLYYMEKQLALGYEKNNDAGNAKMFQKRAESRAQFIQENFWNADIQFYTDFMIQDQKSGNHLNLAGVFPLFFKIATADQAEAVKQRVMNDFLKPGGLITTLIDSGQQWDAPNGWAPLQYITVIGLLNYGYKTEAIEIMTRWLKTNERVYNNTGKMMEKYNVVNTHLLSGGGEYTTQDGFGWTNGVALKFKSLLASLKTN